MTLPQGQGSGGRVNDESDFEWMGEMQWAGDLISRRTDFYLVLQELVAD